MKPFHIVAGLIALLAGAVALYAFKGGRLHRRSGMLFVYTMLLMAASGLVMALIKSQRPNVVGAVIAFYMVSTGLLTVRRAEWQTRWVDVALMLVGAGIGLFSIGLGFEALRSPGGKVDGMPAPPNFVFGSVPLLAALGDLRMLFTARLQGARRLARHLWRLCYAMFVATASFFLGQARHFPGPLRKPALLALPVLLVLAVMFTWLVRLRSRRGSRPTVALVPIEETI